ncbi:MAG: hypothetical protein RL065_1197 [Bacteroidota bacterium]|jgi:phage regulator Rha-like protein
MKPELVHTKIFEIRSQKIMLDFDLAEMYEIETKYLKRAVKHNSDRIPADFMFELTKDEWESLRCNFSTLNNGGRGQHLKYLPFAFTEQGVAMLSSVLNSQKAIQVNISIIRAFVFIRQHALNFKELTEQLKSLETKYDKHFKDVYEALDYLLNNDKQIEQQNKRTKIGYKIPKK